MNLYADIFGRNRVLIALIVVVFSSIAGYGVTFLRLDDIPRKLFASDDEDYHRLERLFEEFGSDDNDCIVVLESDDLFRPDAVRVVRSIASRCRELAGVVSVQSLADVTVFPSGGFPRALLPVPGAPPEVYAQARRDALRHPMAKGQILSPDGRTTLVFVRIEGSIESIEEVQPIVEKVRAIVAEETAGSPVQGSLTGIPTLRTEVIQSLRRIQLRYSVLGVAIAFLVGILVFRRPGAVFIVTVPPFVGVFWALGFLGLLGEKLNVVNSVMPSMILVMAFCDAVHLLSAIRTARREGMAQVEAVQSAIRHVGLACFLASFTTAVGFASLWVANVETIRRLGVDTAMGVLVAFCSTITLVPILASTRLSSDLVLQSASPSTPKPVRWVVRVLMAAVGWPRAVAVAGALLTLYLGWTASHLKPDNRLTETLPTDSESYQTMARCDAAFGGALMVYVVVEFPESVEASSAEALGVLRDVHEMFEAGAAVDDDGAPLLASPLSILNLFESFPGSLERNARLVLAMQHVPGANLLVPQSVIRRFLREDLGKAIVSAHVRDIGSQAYQPVFRSIQRRLEEIEARRPGFRLRLTGTTVVASLKVQDMISSMYNGLLTASVVIFALMAFVFRSVLLGALCIPPNLFPLAFVAALLVWTGQPLQMATVIVFNIGIGMTVDNSIHLVTRFRHEYSIDGDVKGAIHRSGLAVGNPMLSTVVVLLAGFGSLMTSSIPVTRLFALLACAILASAFVADVVLLPAFIASFIRRPRRKRLALPPPAAVESAPPPTTDEVAAASRARPSDSPER